VTEIRIDVDLSHPQELVWRVLTDAAVINSWFPNTGFLATEDGRFTVRPNGVVGLDGPVSGEIVTVEPPHRLVIRLEAPRLHTLMTVSIQPTSIGCRLTVAQRGFLGTQGTMRRRTLQRTYTELVEQRLIPAIERLALAAEPAAEPESAPSREAKRNTAGPFLRVPRQPGATRSEPPRSASAPGLASHVRAPASPPGVSPIPGFGAAVLGARAIPRPVGVVRADEIAKLAASTGDAGDEPKRHRSTVDRSAAGRMHAAVDLVAAGVTVGASSARQQFARLGAWLSEVPRWPAERRSQAIAGLAALLLLIALVALLLAKATAPRPADPPQVGGGPREPGQASVPEQERVPNNPRATSPAASGTPDITTSVSPAAPAASVAATSRLAGTYRTEKQELSGYEGSITITNDTSAPVDGWSATLRMPLLTLVVYDVENAVLTQTGTNVTFTPIDANRTVAPGQSIVVRFQVRGVGAPTECAVDGNTCAGIAE
jgi:uncharacterized protein YndB with AHSA1/START domain